MAWRQNATTPKFELLIFHIATIATIARNIVESCENQIRVVWQTPIAYKLVLSSGICAEKTAGRDGRGCRFSRQDSTKGTVSRGIHC